VQQQHRLSAAGVLERERRLAELQEHVRLRSTSYRATSRMDSGGRRRAAQRNGGVGLDRFAVAEDQRVHRFSSSFSIGRWGVTIQGRGDRGIAQRYHR
jgi:hypothetical protein